MQTCYVTYSQFGSTKRAVISASQYEKLQKDSSVSSLRLYPSQSMMEQAYQEAKGESGAFRKTLLG